MLPFGAGEAGACTRARGAAWLSVEAMDHWQVAENEHGIVITCRGHDKAEQWPVAIRRFAEAMLRRRAQVRVIADLSQMTGYETGARRAWQEAFRAHRRLMRAVVFVGAPSRSIRMGAAVVGAVAGVPVRFVDTWADVANLEH